MIRPYPRVSLSSILRKVEEPVLVEPEETYKQVTVRLFHKGVVLRGKQVGAEIRTAGQWRVRAGQILLSRIDARNGAIGLVPSDLDGAIVTNDFWAFDVDGGAVEPRFLDAYFGTPEFVDACRRASEGTTNRIRLQHERFLGITVPLPPLAEQRRIVVRIEELAAKIEDARHLRTKTLELANAMWSSILDAAFNLKIEPSCEFRGTASDLLRQQSGRYASVPKNGYNNAHPWSPNSLRIGPYELPSHWVWTDLGSALITLVDCVNDTPEFSDEPTGLYGLKSTNIRPYRLDLSESWFMTPEDFAHWNRREIPRPSDLVLTREAPMGNVCILPEGLQVCLTQRLMLMRTDNEFIERRYVLHFLNSTHFKAQVLDRCRGLTTPHIRVKDVPTFLMPLAPREEQQRMVAYLDTQKATIDALRKSQAETAAELDALLHSILDKAFKGEL